MNVTRKKPNTRKRGFRNIEILSTILPFHPIFGSYVVVCSDVGRNLYLYTRFVPDGFSLDMVLKPRNIL